MIEQFSNRKKGTANKLLDAISKRPQITLQQLADENGISKRTVSRYMKEFRDAKILRRVGSDRSGVWEVIGE